MQVDLATFPRSQSALVRKEDFVGMKRAYACCRKEALWKESGVGAEFLLGRIRVMSLSRHAYSEGIIGHAQLKIIQWTYRLGSEKRDHLGVDYLVC